MCGILGIVDRKGVDENLLLQMRDVMVHRGPDDAGLWINRERTVGLGHRRLSIIDLSEAGKQPMSDCNKQIWVTFNGEIYNFQEIRDELKKKGYKFRSHTDTEIIANAYKEWGTDCLERFNGMFAFGIYDEEKKMIFIARDRVGKKPLYYSRQNGGLRFASELKALMKDPSLPKEIDLQALNHYLTFGYIGGDLCIFKSIRKLPPAHAMTYDAIKDESRIWKYWEPPRFSGKILSEDELIEDLEALLRDAVRLRMISDVPLGAFLSGGLDSSLVVAIMSKISKDPVRTFTIGFEESRHNEVPFARIVADHFRTDHHEIIVKPDAFAILPELVRQFDEPFADSSMIPTYYVSKATREYVTVALSGDGGDELFGGYSQYQGTLVNHYMSQFIPLVFRKQIAKIAELLPQKIGARRHLSRVKYDPYDAFLDRCSSMYFNSLYRRSLLNSDVIDFLGDSFMMPETIRRRHLIQATYDFINCLSHGDFKTYLPDDILVKVDRASMLVSLEVRAPFLDYRMVDFSFKNIPGNLKLKGVTLKYLLKKLAKRILPRELSLNRKWGFSIPAAEWFRRSLFPEIEKILLENRSGLFKKDYIDRLLAEHKSGTDHSGRIFALVVFLLWENMFS